MKRILRIGIDIDDVLIKSVDRAVVMYNNAYGTSITRDTWYDFSDPSVWGGDDLPSLVKKVVDVFTDPAFQTVLPMEDAYETLVHLRGEGHKLFAITGRSESIRPQTMSILDACFPGFFTHETVFFVDHFSHDGQKASKADVGTKLELTHFIDDQVEHVNVLHRAGITAVLFSQNYKWNRTGADESIVRLSDWQSIKEFLDAEADRAE